MNITTKYEFPLSDIMENVQKEIKNLETSEGVLIEQAKNEWQELYKQLDNAQSQLLRLNKLYPNEQ